MKYLLVTYIRKPNGQIDEQVGFSKRLRNSDLQTCNVIVDYATRTVVKCVIEGSRRDTTFESMDEYYAEHYPKHIEALKDANPQPEIAISQPTEEKTDGQ